MRTPRSSGSELGVTRVDGYDLYGNGANEELIGRAIAGR